MISFRVAALTAFVVTIGAVLPAALYAQDLAQGAPRLKLPTTQQPKPNLPAIELSEQLLYKLMVAEIAQQRGQTQVAMQAYLELARETGDPRIAQRATEVAWNARLQPQAIEAASLWLKADPKSTQARQVIAALLVTQEKLDEARPHLEQWLAADKANVGPNFVQLAALLTRHKDSKAVLELVQSLARPYSEVADVRLAVAQAAWNAEDVDLSLAESRAALRIKPDFELAALFHAQALQRRSNAEAITFLGEFLQRNPKAADARLNYARLLVAERRHAEARQQFETLTRDFPQNPDIAVAVGLLAMQAHDYDAAETHLKSALENSPKDPDSVRMYLGQVNEERKRYDEALKWYGQIVSGNQFVGAQSRYAGVLAKQGKLEEGRKHLQQITPSNNVQRIQLVQAEGNLLREAGSYQEAFSLLGTTLEKNPDSVDLLYDQAMIAEKIDRVDVLENNLRKVIQMQPDHAHAYNALGYTLADRGQRLPEARKLIEKALELSPQDPFIMDSMGWVLFRMGQTREAVEQLRRAFAIRSDAEVGAHLGEVLWADGKRDEAQKIWSDLLKDNASNEILEGTVKRLAPALLPAK